MSIAGALPGDDPDAFAAGPRPLRRESGLFHSISRGQAVVPVSDDGSSATEFGQYRLLLDGRIDNYPEIAAALKTENSASPALLIAAYLRWRDDFPDRILGDSALALWDGHGRRLLLARDAAGRRPLHYWVRGNEFRFASEARALFEAGDIPLAIEEARVAEWLTMNPPRENRTFFRGICSVPCGHTLIFERGRVRLQDFWAPAGIPELRLSDPREYADGLRCVLRQAVKHRIKGPSRIGSHLSGGLDSSGVTATAAQLLGERGDRLTAFTAVPTIPVEDARFPRRFCNEASHAAATVAMYPNIEHVLIPNYSRRMLDVLDLMSTAAESPQLNPGNSIWFYAICLEASRRGLRVMLTGTGGNLTMSYDGRRALASLIRGGRVLNAARLALAFRRRQLGWPSILNLAVRPLLPSFVRYDMDRLRGISPLKIENMTGLRPEFALAHGIRPEQAIERGEERDGRRLRIGALCRGDLGGHIAAFRRLAGIEQADPATDRRVMDYCLSVPEEHYVRNGEERSLMKDAMAGALPEKILKEKRVGRQSADLLFHLAPETQEIAAEFQRLRRSDLAMRCLDVPRMQELLLRWPTADYGHPEYMQYGIQLMRALSMGRFLRRIEDGVLFPRGHAATAP